MAGDDVASAIARERQALFDRARRARRFDDDVRPFVVRLGPNPFGTLATQRVPPRAESRIGYAYGVSGRRTT